MQVVVLRDVIVCNLEWQREKCGEVVHVHGNHNKMCHELLKNKKRGRKQKVYLRELNQKNYIYSSKCNSSELSPLLG